MTLANIHYVLKELADQGGRNAKQSMHKQVLLKKADSRVRENLLETMTAELSPVEWLEERQWGILSISERIRKFQVELLLL